jgi:hypothetical protein
MRIVLGNTNSLIDIVSPSLSHMNIDVMRTEGGSLIILQIAFGVIFGLYLLTKSGTHGENKTE